MGYLVVVSGYPATGTGKTTVVGRVLERLDNAARIVTCTTRQKRENEKDGRDYYFLSEKAFLDGLALGDFLEHDQHYAHWYGTRKSDVALALASNKFAMLTTDLSGAKTLKGLYADACFIAVVATTEDASKFMSGRGDKAVKISERLTETQLKKEKALLTEVGFNFVIQNKPGELEAVIKQFFESLELFESAAICMQELKSQKTH